MIRAPGRQGREGMGYARLAGGVALAASLLAGSSLTAQEQAGRVTGRVLDAATNLPVAGALIRARGASTEARSRVDGRFVLQVRSPDTLRVTRSGYAARDTVLLPSADVEIRIARHAIEIAGITVTSGRRDPPTGGHYELSPVGIARVPPLAEPDLFRAVATLPGVDQPNGWRSAFHVRGGASDETLVLLDGIPLTEPYHMLGLFGGVQLGVVEGATLHLGAPPAQYEDRLSGIIEIRTLVPDSAFYQAHASLLSAGGVVGQRWGHGEKKGSLLLGGRYASTELIGAALDLGRYGFSDGNLRLRQHITGGWVLDASGFWNADWISDIYGAGDAVDTGRPSFRPDYRWGNKAGRVGAIRSGAGGSMVRADLTYSDYGIRFHDVPRGGGHATEIIDAHSGILKFALLGERGIGSSHRVSVGLDVQRERFENRWQGAVEEFSSNIPPSYQYAAEQNRVAGYVSNRWTPAAGLEISTGMRLLYVRGGAAAGPHIAPRLAARWHAAEQWEVFGSAGRLFQTTTQAEEAREGNLSSPRFALPEPNRADAAELGAEWAMSARSSVRVTGFAKRYGRITQLDSAAVLLYPSAPYPTFRVGMGRSGGVEALFTRSGERFDAQLAYTYTRTRVDFGVEVAPDWDAPHSAKGLASLALGRGWRATGAATLRSGLPYTPVLGAVLLPDGPGAERRVRRAYVTGETNGRRLPTARRLDAGVEKQGRLRRADYTLRFQVINLLDDKTMLRLNPAAYYDYGAQGPAIDDAFDRSVPFMPSLGVELHF